MRMDALKIDEYVKIVEEMMPELKNTNTEQINRIANALKGIIEGADFPVFALRDEIDLRHTLAMMEGLNVDPIIAGLMLGIMYERTFILKQLKEQGVVIVRLDH